MATSRTRPVIVSALAVLALVIGLAGTAAAKQRVEGAEVWTTSGFGIQSASVRDGDVYLHVEGTGLYVDFVYTRAAPPNDINTKAYYWADGVLVAESTWVWVNGSQGQEVASQWDALRNFADGTRICVTWANITGKPCATIRQ